MAKVAELKTKCVCGTELNFIAQKPTFLTPTVTRKACTGCSSRYMFKCRMVTSSSGKRIAIDPEILFLSQKAKESAAKNIEARKALSGTVQGTEK